jgi:flagellar assembly protein FliH
MGDIIDGKDDIKLQSVDRWKFPDIAPQKSQSICFKKLEPLEEKKLTEEVQKQRELKRQEAIDKGYNEGLARGRKEAFDQEIVAFNKKTAELSKLICSMQECMQTLEEQLSDTVKDLALTIVKAVIKAEIATNPEIIQNTVKEALKSLPKNSKDINLKINPKDADFLNSIEDEEFKETINNVQLTLDETIARGGVKINSENSFVDAELDTRLDAVLARLTDG